jgi:hypothetical protein
LSATLEAGGHQIPVVALESYTRGATAIEPTMTAGRPPIADDEVVFAATTRRQLGVHVGDVIHVGLVTDGDGTLMETDLKVVGEAVLSDGLALQPGNGALITAAAFRQANDDTQPQVLGVRLEPGVDRVAVLDEVRHAFPTTFSPPITPLDVRNLVRIAGLPLLLAGIVVLFALAALAHTLVLSLRRQRKQLAVLKSIGFTRRQVVAVVSWQASSVAMLAVAIGVPLGVIGSRLLWGMVVDRVGVLAPPVVPVGAAVAVTVAFLIVANLVAAAPAWSAARAPTAAALRTE